jgi:hypothetical protein
VHRSPWRLLAVVVVANAVYLGLVVATLRAGERRGIAPAQLLRDPLAVVVGPLHAGLLSSVGVLAWSAAAGACLLAGGVLVGLDGSRREGRLLLGIGLLTLTLAADDLLLFHEGIAPRWLGLSEDLVLASYALAAVALLVGYRDVVRRLATRWLVLVSVLAFATSAGVDLFLEAPTVYRVEEDLAKTVGVWNWSLAWGLGAGLLVRQAVVGAHHDAEVGA